MYKYLLCSFLLILASCQDESEETMIVRQQELILDQSLSVGENERAYHIFVAIQCTQRDHFFGAYRLFFVSGKTA
ncbi:MAG: hypothetical protein ACFB0B_08795 [Thermonemataceae bacterium]